MEDGRGNIAFKAKSVFFSVALEISLLSDDTTGHGCLLIRGSGIVNTNVGLKFSYLRP